MRVTIVGAISGLVAGVTVSLVNGQFNLFGKHEERLTLIQLEDRKLQSNLILKAIDTKDAGQSIKTLEFFAETNLIPDYKDGVLEFLAKKDVGERIPTLKKETTPYKTLNELTRYEKRRYSNALASVGMLITPRAGYSHTGCAASLIRDDIIATTYRCIDIENLDTVSQGEFLFGELVEKDPHTTHRIDRLLLYEVKTGLVLLKLKQPLVDFIPLELAHRNPEGSESLLMIYRPYMGDVAISKKDCSVASSEPYSDLHMNFNCLTSVGSHGAMVLAKKDMKVLGIYMGENGTNKIALLSKYMIDALSVIDKK